MIDAKRLAEMMEPGNLHLLAAFVGTLGKAHGMATDESDALDCVAAVLRFVANEHGWQSLDIMRGTPRQPDERFSAWHARCRVKMLKARVAGRGEGKASVTFPTADEAERSLRESFGAVWGGIVTPDAIRDGIAQAFAEMPDQIYNAISEAVFSHLQKHGVQCPKAKP